MQKRAYHWLVETNLVVLYCAYLICQLLGILEFKELAWFLFSLVVSISVLVVEPVSKGKELKKYDFFGKENMYIYCIRLLWWGSVSLLITTYSRQCLWQAKMIGIIVSTGTDANSDIWISSNNFFVCQSSILSWELRYVQQHCVRLLHFTLQLFTAPTRPKILPSKWFGALRHHDFYAYTTAQNFQSCKYRLVLLCL